MSMQKMINLIGILRMPCLFRKSFISGALIIFRRKCDGALKCALRDFRADDDTN